MLIPRFSTALVLGWASLHMGCMVYRGVKVASSPVSVAAEVVKQAGKATARGAEATGTVAGKAMGGAGRMIGAGVEATSRVSATSVTTSGAVAGEGIRSGGRVAVSGMGASSRVAAAGVGATGTLTAQSIAGLAKLSEAGMVTLVDYATGTVMRIPWRAGLTVYGSGALAHLRTAGRVLAVVRQGRVVLDTVKALAGDRAFPLQPGDVLRLADRI